MPRPRTQRRPCGKASDNNLQQMELKVTIQMVVEEGCEGEGGKDTSFSLLLLF